MSAITTRRWYWVHKWSSLVCAVFLLVICVSGLPLIFIDEISNAVQISRAPAPWVSGDTHAADVDRMIAQSRARFPGQLISSIAWDDDAPVAFISMVSSFKAAKDNPDLEHWLKFDVRTGELVNTSEQYDQDMRAIGPAIASTFMSIMLRVHIDLYARLPGQLFLCAMALLFVAAIVSGVVLYGPFMKKQPFGTVRRERSVRLKWLDLHNVLGIVTLSWALVVGLTGAINEISSPLLKVWINTDVRSAWTAYAGDAPPLQRQMTSVQAALETARRAVPGMTITSLLFPQPDFGNSYHFWFWAKGNTHLTERLMTVVLVDARTGALTRVLRMPWYLTVLDLSRPLHFGDYGGLPLKVLWTLLDVLTIFVLASGLYLWFARRAQNKQRLARLIQAHTGPKNGSRP